MNKHFLEIIDGTIKYAIPFVSLAISLYALRKVSPKVITEINGEWVNKQVYLLTVSFFNRSSSPTTILNDRVLIDGINAPLSPYEQATTFDGELLFIDPPKSPIRLEPNGAISKEFILFISSDYAGKEIEFKATTTYKSINASITIPHQTEDQLNSK